MEEKIYEAAAWGQIALCVGMGGAGLLVILSLLQP